jgi:hypothetical protein
MIRQHLYTLSTNVGDSISILSVLRDQIVYGIGTYGFSVGGSVALDFISTTISRTPWSVTPQIVFAVIIYYISTQGCLYRCQFSHDVSHTNVFKIDKYEFT